jgi:hypothetical protein
MSYFDLEVGVLVSLNRIEWIQNKKSSSDSRGFSLLQTLHRNPFRMNILTNKPFRMKTLREIKRANPHRINILDNK